MLALALGSCDGGDELDSDEPKSSAHSKPHTPSTAQPMSLQDADVLAPGRGLRVIGRTRGKVGPHAYTGVGAITPDGQLVVDVFERNVSEPPAVYSAALDGTGRLRKEYNGEIVPQATSHGVFTIDATQGPWRIRAHDIGSGKSRTITKAAHNKETIDDLVAAGDKMAWITRGNGSSQLYVKTGSEEPRLLVRTKKELYYPIITNRYVGFETPNETAYIYDFDARALYRLTRRQAPMAAGYGNYVAWTDRSKKQTVVAKLTSS